VSLVGQVGNPDWGCAFRSGWSHCDKYEVGAMVNVAESGDEIKNNWSVKNETGLVDKLGVVEGRGVGGRESAPGLLFLA